MDSGVDQRAVVVTWRLPVGVASTLDYLHRQLRAFPSPSAAAEMALRRALDQDQAPA